MLPGAALAIPSRRAAGTTSNHSLRLVMLLQCIALRRRGVTRGRTLQAGDSGPSRLATARPSMLEERDEMSNPNLPAESVRIDRTVLFAVMNDMADPTLGQP